MFACNVQGLLSSIPNTVLLNLALCPSHIPRLMADESPETEQVAANFRVLEVPTFIFLRNGREVARHVGSSRGDLIGKILQVRQWRSKHWRHSATCQKASCRLHVLAVDLVQLGLLGMAYT